MAFESWILLIGGVLLLTALAAAYVRRLPFTTTMLYLGLGALLGPAGWGVLQFDPHEQGRWFYRAAEIAVVVSLFTVGLKLRLPLRWWRHRSSCTGFR